MKTVLITGGSRGIGRATVKEFLKNNWKVITTSTSGKLDYEDKNLSVFQLNLESEKSISKFSENLKKAKISIDCLINNAAWLKDGEGFVIIDSLRKTLEINLIGTIDLTQKILSIIPKDSIIINVSSQMSSLTKNLGYDCPSYRISKAGINMYTKSLSLNPEIISRNIKVYNFDPGWVKTDMGGYDAPRQPEEPAKELYDLANSNLPSGEFYKGTTKRDW